MQHTWARNPLSSSGTSLSACSLENKTKTSINVKLLHNTHKCMQYFLCTCISMCKVGHPFIIWSVLLCVDICVHVCINHVSYSHRGTLVQYGHSIVTLSKFFQAHMHEAWAWHCFMQSHIVWQIVNQISCTIIVSGHSFLHLLHLHTYYIS